MFGKKEAILSILIKNQFTLVTVKLCKTKL